jgi:hypothetical protein
MRAGRDIRGRLGHALGLVPDANERAASFRLGPGHPLVRLLARRRSLAVQIAVTSIPVVLAVVGTARGVDSARIVLAVAVAVQLALLMSMPVLRRRTHDATRDLIAAGDVRALSIPVVADDRNELVSEPQRERLAASLESLVETAAAWRRRVPLRRLPLGVLCMRHALEDAREVVALLRADDAQARGVALTARLLWDGASPLYGEDADALRRELARIRYLLVARAPDLERRRAA